MNTPTFESPTNSRLSRKDTPTSMIGVGIEFQKREAPSMWRQNEYEGITSVCCCREARDKGIEGRLASPDVMGCPGGDMSLPDKEPFACCFRSFRVMNWKRFGTPRLTGVASAAGPTTAWVRGLSVVSLFWFKLVGCCCVRSHYIEEASPSGPVL